tara:strand:- start:3280 stop:3597 length:318 start_codon:yes stop_codon:yes gene_type:complete
MNNWNTKIIETSLKYDDHNPEHRKELENYLKRTKRKPIETRRGALNKKSNTKVPLKKAPSAATSPLNIDINFFNPIKFYEVLEEPRIVEQKKSTGLANILGVNDD